MARPHRTGEVFFATMKRSLWDSISIHILVVSDDEDPRNRQAICGVAPRSNVDGRWGTYYDIMPRIEQTGTHRCTRCWDRARYRPGMSKVH